LADFELIETHEDLDALVQDLLGEKILAFDTEADSFYHYFDKTCLVQVATRKQIYLIDPLTLGGPAELAALAPVFASPDIRKIFHAAEYDLFVLKRDCSFQFQNLFDTMICAQLLGYPSVGLASLCERHFDVKLPKDEQRSDWSRRPLTQRQLSYAAADVLYRNDGDRFTDVSEPAGIWKARGNGLGVVSGDFNVDGWPDLYVANDGMPNQLWINGGDGSFEDRALIAGTAVNLNGAAEAGMGIAVADLENDGDPDLFVTHLRAETNTLYLNEGGVFDDVTATTGLAAPSVALTGFGTGFADFDNDGYLDLYVGNGRVGSRPPAAAPFSEPNQLFRGFGSTRFELVVPSGGTETQVIDNTRAVAFADYDLDGGVDAIIVNNGGRARLLHNVVGANRGWLALEVLEAAGSEATGARIAVVVGDRMHWRTVGRASSYLASNSGLVHVGLGDETTVDDVIVHWADGLQTRYGPLRGRAVYSLRRGFDAKTIDK